MGRPGEPLPATLERPPPPRPTAPGPGVVRWRRSEPEPRAAEAPPGGSGVPVCCLWRAGRLANRSEASAAAGTGPDQPVEELLAALHARHGAAGMARRLAGAVACILWDGRRRELVAVRDRLGTHGLYYARRGDEILVAGQVEPLLAALGGAGPLNRRSVVAQVNGLAPLPGETFYERIQAVPPGAALTVGLDSLHVESYWRVERQPALRLGSDAEYAEALRQLLFTVVEGYVDRQPAGVTLSGGLDSTSVAAAIRAVAPAADLTAIAWTTPSLPDADETRYSRAAAEHLQLPYLAMPADRCWPMSGPQGLRTRPGTPFTPHHEGLWAATLEAAREGGIRVLFSGGSGDHLFGGSVFSYSDQLLTGRWRQLARELATHAARSKLGLPRILREMVLAPVPAAFLPGWRSNALQPVPWLAGDCRELFRQHFARKEGPYGTLPGTQQRLRMMRHPGLSLVMERVNGQAAEQGIEFRHPLLDHRLWEFAASLPCDQTFRAAVRKPIVRRAMRGYLPDLVLDLEGKIELTSLVRRGLAERETARVWELLTGMRAAALGFVDEARLRQAYGRYLAGEESSDVFWNTLTLEDWLRRYH